MSLDAVGIISKDIKQSVQFYGILGGKFKELKGSSGHWEADTETGVRLMLDSVDLIKKINPKWTETSETTVQV